MRWTQILYDFKKVGELTKKWSNLPDSYIKRSMEQVLHETPDGVEYLPRRNAKAKIKFTKDRPWTFQSRLENSIHVKTPVVYVEPIRNWSIFRGDRVQILDGKDAGKQGIVDLIFQERNWVTVQNLNMKLKTISKDKDKPAIVLQEEQPLRVTDQVTLVDPSDMLPCKVEWRYTEKGERVRVSLRSGRIIPVPQAAMETVDFKNPRVYEEREKDTVADVVSKITFKPKLATFEMDIMEEHGILEDRNQVPFYCVGGNHRKICERKGEKYMCWLLELREKKESLIHTEVITGFITDQDVQVRWKCR